STKDTFVLGNSVTSTVENSLFFGNESAYVADDGARTKGNAKATIMQKLKLQTQTAMKLLSV
ncbi:MAG: hypothetical protein IKI43_02240, partial [Campylobacter sp.]|nr:hypothetical protein [Campylobacter sp.]